MAWTGKSCAAMEYLLPRIKQLPDEIHFDVNIQGEGEFICFDQDAARIIRNGLRLPDEPPIVWARQWEPENKWWEYGATLGGVRCRIYGVANAPSCCHAIIERRTTMQKVPLTFEERPVEQEVIVGWQCGDETELK